MAAASSFFSTSLLLSTLRAKVHFGLRHQIKPLQRAIPAVESTIRIGIFRVVGINGLGLLRRGRMYRPVHNNVFPFRKSNRLN